MSSYLPANQLEILKEYWSQIKDEKTKLTDELKKQVSFFINNELILPEIAFYRTTPAFERIVINNRISDVGNSRIKEIKYLKNPPPECVLNYGRANLKYQSVFYATFFHPTAIKEMRPNETEIYTVSKWELSNESNNHDILTYPIFRPRADSSLYLKLKEQLFEENRDDEFTLQIEQLFKGFPKKEKIQIINLLIFISDCFAQKENKNSQNVYFFTASLANKIFNSIYDGKIEAITYPSVQDDVPCENIVLKPSVVEKKYNLAQVTDFKVSNSINSGKMHLGSAIGKANKFQDGKIIWD